MDENTQNLPEVTGVKPSLLSNSIAIAVLFFITGALISGTIVLWSQEQRLKAATEEVRRCTASKTDCVNSELEINWNDRLLLSKNYGKLKIGAYSVSDLLEGVFIVAPIDNGQPTSYGDAYALSFASDAFMRDNLFDVVGDKIYVLNQNKGFIDIYTASFSDRTPATPAFYTMHDIDSINGPKYKVGVPYSIKCQDNLCQIDTALHQQSGCSMELNLKTEQYASIKCGSMGGDFNPEPL